MTSIRKYDDENGVLEAMTTPPRVITCPRIDGN